MFCPNIPTAGTIKPEPENDKRKLICLAGANGDLLAMFPLFKYWNDMGRRAAVVVSPTYAPVLEAIDTVDVHVMDKAYTKKNPDNKIIERNVRAAASNFPRHEIIHLSPVIGTQRKKVDHTRSFITHMWNLCGALPLWDALPMVLDNREPDRERQLWRQANPKDSPVIAVAPHGLSSPFVDRQRLMTMLVKVFKDFKILDLSKVNAHRIYDLLGILDRSACLITIDTAHMHLAKASPVPVVGLAQDSPPWKGSPMSSNMVAYARYGEYMNREAELISMAHKAAYRERIPKPVRIEGIPSSAYNPSAVHYPGGWLVMYRFHPEWNFRTQLGAVLLDKNWKIQRMLRVIQPREANTMSCEDPRLFIYDNQIWVSYTVARPSGRTPKCAVMYARVVMRDSHVEIVDAIMPKIGENDLNSMEKNWVFWEQDRKLMCNYNENVVYEILNGRKYRTIEHKPYVWPWGQVHGGTVPILHKSGNLLRFFHSRYIHKGRAIPHRYHIGAMLVDPVTYEVVEQSEYPVISGNEMMYPGIFHWKANVVFPASAHEHGGGYRIVLGVNDVMCATLDVREEDLNLKRQ